jgi:hypothetical protein
MKKYGNGMLGRRAELPLAVFQDAETSRFRCVNGLHVQTFIANPFGHEQGTLITFASGDRVTVTDDFDHVFEVLTGIVDG